MVDSRKHFATLDKKHEKLNHEETEMNPILT